MDAYASRSADAVSGSGHVVARFAHSPVAKRGVTLTTMSTNTPRPSNTQESTAVAALITGIITVLLSLFCGLLAIPTGIAAIVFGMQGRRRSIANGQGSGLAVAGIALGGVGILITAAFFLWISR